ncbi:type I-F CRISPR-associated protein Csy1 [Providencia rettgeri]|nr:MULTISPECIES: type I-F CRISPR-associated protein Csy1 [Providencia]EIL1981518.1 type I-F CRISPR-associated protein Csy1 [Providencia rettgeri]EIU9514070.1 type I-F CRISPR-associated protein Csy1 [Providencia rettgeri]EJD6042700.1 type I-F CRISPR-associated protein Csy1 [Providencia rettgeri]EJD6368076.1 type I-F CRISPR-associated protein Csy1 [Providencia rettgeri]EJD6371659.1 type I-F CRISPR-associated protein Csy1 [Providencia rettgeri]
MLDPAIEAFFTERKESWLKKNVKASMSEGEIQQLQQKCDAILSLAQWLPSAAKRAGQISLSTHPCTFSHPSSRKNKNGYVTPILARAEHTNDGLLRTGNVMVETDALGNAAALDVYKFLTLELQDNRTLLAHIKDETPLAKDILNQGDEEYHLLRDGFLAMVAADKTVITSSKIKQVYFPVWLEDNEYHLLSPLTPSGLVFELRKRIDTIRFSEQTKALRDLKRKGEFSQVGYKEIYGLTTIGYGGTKPQNISVLNNQNAGKAHLLPSLPPQIAQRKRRLPTYDFFTNTVNPWQVKETLEAFHGLISLPKAQRGSRFIEYRDRRIQEYVDYIMLTMWEVRRGFEQNNIQLPTQLAKVQQIWLFPDQQQRNNSDEWLEGIITLIAQQFMRHYKKVLGKKAIALGNDELAAIAQVIAINKELLR